MNKFFILILVVFFYSNPIIAGAKDQSVQKCSVYDADLGGNLANPDAAPQMQLFDS